MTGDPGTRRARPGEPERGQTSVLVVGFAMVLMMVVALVVDATAAYLRRQGLHTLADGAALAAAEAVEGEHVYTHGLGERAVVDGAAARRHVADHLDAVGAHARYPGLRHHVRITGTTVVVTLRSPLDLPIPLPGWAAPATVTGRAAAFVGVPGG